MTINDGITDSPFWMSLSEKIITDFLFSVISNLTFSHTISNASSREFSSLWNEVDIIAVLFFNNFPFVSASYDAPLKIGESKVIKLACCAVSFRIEPLFPK